MLFWQKEGLWAEIVSFGSFGISAEMKFFEMGFRLLAEGQKFTFGRPLITLIQYLILIYRYIQVIFGSYLLVLLFRRTLGEGGRHGSEGGVLEAREEQLARVEYLVVVIRRPGLQTDS